MSRSSKKPSSSSPRTERAWSTPPAKTIGAAVRAERKRQGLTQEQLALVAGVGSRSVGLIEMGKETAQLDVLIRLLDTSYHSPGAIIPYDPRQVMVSFASAASFATVVTSSATQWASDHLFPRVESVYNWLDRRVSEITSKAWD